MTENLAGELRTFAGRLTVERTRGEQADIAEPLDKLEQAATAIGKAWSRSNMGYQSRVYYNDFDPPPPGAHFESEWGFLGQFQGTTGDWREYQFDDVIKIVYRIAGVPSLDDVIDVARHAHDSWTELRPEIVSVLSAYLAEHQDALIEHLQTEAEQASDLTEIQAARALVGPIGPKMVRDTTALSQGFQTAPHQSVQARVIAIRSMFTASSALASIANRAASHMERLEQSRRSRGQAAQAPGENVFIGHGRSLLWRELKDFISDRLGLPWDEFNRVPVAGVTNIARLSEMLDSARIAFVVLTAEDETIEAENGQDRMSSMRLACSKAAWVSPARSSYLRMDATSSRTSKGLDRSASPGARSAQLSMTCGKCSSERVSVRSRASFARPRAHI